MKPESYSDFTEMPGTRVSREQIQRLVNRYHFAAGFSQGKDVLELACGPGIGLDILKRSARSLVVGDIDPVILQKAKEAHDCSLDCQCVDAQDLPFADNSFDVIILFEAIYYLERPDRFVKEARRVLRNNGTMIVCNPNKDLHDFNPSAFSHAYFNAPEFRDLLKPTGFLVSFFGDCPVKISSPKMKVLNLLKKWAVRLNLIPKTMRGKVFFKRIVFGELSVMPTCISGENIKPTAISPISGSETDLRHKVLFCVAVLDKK